MPDKILIVGSVNGRLTELISKVSAIQSKHGPFTALFILGDLFHPSPPKPALQQQSDLLQGQLQLPIPTYFYQGSAPPSDLLADHIFAASKQPQKDVSQGLVKLADNLFWARGKSGVFTLPTGFRIAFVGGVWDASKFAETIEAEGGQFDPETWYESDLQRVQDEQTTHITPATIHRLLANPSFRLPSTSSAPSSTSSASSGSAKPGTLAAARALASADHARTAAQTAALELLTARPPIDLLLTNCWPTGITLFSTPAPSTDPLGGLPDATARMWGSPAIARLASHACPRYHFSLAPSASSQEDPSLPVGIAREALDMGAFWERPPYTTNLASYLSAAQQQQLQSTPQGRRQVESLKAVTRFVSLAKFANEKKKRWFLALNLTPADQQQQQQQQQQVPPANATQTPYSVPQQRHDAVNGKRSAPQQEGAMDSGPNYRFQEPRSKRQRAEAGGSEDVPPPGYVCRICNVEGHYIRLCPLKQQQQQQQQQSQPDTAASTPLPVTHASDGPKHRWTKSTMPLPPGLPSKPAFAQHPHQQRRQMIPVGPSNCWFCLSNPAIAKNLIVSIAAESYLVFPKGPFIDASINAVPHDAAHLLVVPLAHTSNLLPPAHPVLSGSSIDQADADERQRTRSEMDDTKASVRRVWAATHHVMLEWTLVRVRTSSRMTHFQTQVLALLDKVVQSRSLVNVLDDALQALAPASILRTTDEIQSYLARSEPEAPPEQQQQQQQDGYFHMAIHPLSAASEADTKEWLVPLTTASRFPVQFVRTTLASALQLPHLADWKSAEAHQQQQQQHGNGEESVEKEDDEGEREKHRSAAFRSLLLG